MKCLLKKFLDLNLNEDLRNRWLKETLGKIPSDLRILDAGAGELRNKPLCAHLKYVSQDVCEYEGVGDGQGLQTGSWDSSNVDIVCDIVKIPEPDSSFDVILCSEVFEHLPDALEALKEFNRLLKPDGKLIITAPFASFVHFAPYHYATGFSRYWYEHHLPLHGFKIQSLAPSGNWFSYVWQEILRLPSMSRKYGVWYWPVTYFVVFVGFICISFKGRTTTSSDVACFGWHCVAHKSIKV